MSTDDDMRARVSSILTTPSAPLPKRRRTARHRTLVRNALGVPLRCAWDDCEHNGFEEVKVIVRDRDKNLHYVFCSERHKRMHIAGHRSYGNLSA